MWWGQIIWKRLNPLFRRNKYEDFLILHLFCFNKAVRQTQEREAKQKMREKAKELQRKKMEEQKRGGIKGGPSIGSSAGYGGSGGFVSAPSVGDTLSTPAEPPKPTFNSSM